MTFGIFTTCQRRPYTICIPHTRPELGAQCPGTTQPTVVVHGNCVAGCSMMSCLFVNTQVEGQVSATAFVSVFEIAKKLPLLNYAT